nr:MAG TPA: hypothetical protein [Caudoviricetes sp.]
MLYRCISFDLSGRIYELLNCKVGFLPRFRVIKNK